MIVITNHYQTNSSGYSNNYYNIELRNHYHYYLHPPCFLIDVRDSSSVSKTSMLLFGKENFPFVECDV